MFLEFRFIFRIFLWIVRNKRVMQWNLSMEWIPTRFETSIFSVQIKREIFSSFFYETWKTKVYLWSQILNFLEMSIQEHIKQTQTVYKAHFVRISMSMKLKFQIHLDCVANSSFFLVE